MQYNGVSWDKRKSKWFAQIQQQGKRRFLGYHDAEEQAARAYDRAAATLYGSAAQLNLPASQGEAVSAAVPASASASAPVSATTSTPSSARSQRSGASGRRGSSDCGSASAGAGAGAGLAKTTSDAGTAAAAAAAAAT